jgi:copper chaperone NosL
MTARVWLAIALVGVGAACGGGTLSPAAFESGVYSCTHCRMVVVDQRFASQIVRPGEEPFIFDDLACLRNYLDAHPIPGDAAVYVSDHRTLAWVSASDAVFSHVDHLSAPMGGHIVAHETEASLDADPEAAGGRRVARSDVMPGTKTGGRP